MPIPNDFAGNTLATARALSLNPNAQTFTDWVGTQDPMDYYGFTLSGRSSFTLALNGLTADANSTKTITLWFNGYFR